jgi:hypothetical protein
MKNIGTTKTATACTSALEREIDALVYALYGLTPDEIKIVESASAGELRRDKSAAGPASARQGGAAK